MFRLSKRYEGARQYAVRNYLFVAVLLIACAGCGRGGEQLLDDRAAVSGVVSFKGEPLPGGVITFRSQESHVSTAAIIREGGTYSTNRAPLGQNLVEIDTESLQLGNPAAYVRIPQRYRDAATSGLKADLQPGENKNVHFALDE